MLYLTTGDQNPIVLSLYWSNSHMLRSSYKPCIISGNSLQRICCKFALFSSAHKLFDGMPVRDIGSWDPPIDVYSQIGMSLRDFNVHDEAKTIGLYRYSYAGALSICAKNGNLRNGRIIHGLVVVTGFARLVFLTNCLFEMYSDCGEIDEARRVFDYASEIDDVSWNLLFSAYVRIGWPEVAADILVWMHRNGVKLNNISLVSVLKAFLSFDEQKEAKRLLHGCVIKVGLDLDVFVGDAMHYIFARNGGLDEAIGVFECISNQSSVVFSAMIQGFSQLGADTCTEVQLVALRLYVEMMRRRMRPSKLALKSVLDACTSNNEFRFAKQIHAHIIKNNLEEDAFISSALITAYSGLGFIGDCLKCFESAPEQDSITWASMIQGYINHGQLERAMELFRDILRLGRKPCRIVFSSLAAGSGNLGAVGFGKQLHCLAIKEGSDQFTVCGNSMMFFYSNVGDFDACIKIFKDIINIDVTSWSLAILSHGFHGLAKEGMVLFEKMKESKASPKQSTFLAVLTACSHGGLMDEGFGYLESMSTEYGLRPNVEHCACIIDLLGRNCHFAAAEDFILTSGWSNDPLLWSALLRSCQFHGETERIVHVAEKLMQLDPLSATSYTILYNIYLATGKVSMAMRIRGKMRERAVNKQADVCWIEIGASVHLFAADDDSRPQNTAILAKLEEMLKSNKKSKDYLAKSHGEVSAVALGMIRLPKSVPIRVMKNARVCGDCHAILKMFSESEGRKIIVRDTTRFHHFSLGSCSCGDYW